MNLEARLRELAINLPSVPTPVANYLPAVVSGNLLFLSGQLPRDGDKLLYKGLCGKEISETEGYEAARLCALNALAVIRASRVEDRVKRAVKITVFVASAPGFNAQSKVADGASDVMVKFFGDMGKHARSAVGVSSLPLDASVEAEFVFELD